MINHFNRLQTIKNEHFSGIHFGLKAIVRLLRYGIYFFPPWHDYNIHRNTNTRLHFNTAPKPKTLHKMPAGCNECIRSALKGRFSAVRAVLRKAEYGCGGTVRFVCVHMTNYTQWHIWQKNHIPHREVCREENSKSHYWATIVFELVVGSLETLGFAQHLHRHDIIVVTFKLSLFIQKSGTINFNLSSLLTQSRFKKKILYFLLRFLNSFAPFRLHKYNFHFFFSFNAFCC